ncbi:thioredoxin-like protein [Blastocladiella britannica]|nr:thioredoxin-like protein [Blastocladiella britannica]
MLAIATRIASVHASRPTLARAASLSLLHQLRRSLSDDTKTRIESAIASKDVCLFMKGTQEQPMCGFSRAAVQVLEYQGVNSFATVNVLEDADIREGIKEFSDWPTIPQLYVKGQFVGGTDIMIDMFKKGELEELLVKEGVIEPTPEETTQKKQ